MNSAPTLTYKDLPDWASDASRPAALRASVPMESAEVFEGLSLIRPAVYAGTKPGDSRLELIPMRRDGRPILVVTVASRESQAKAMSSAMRSLHDTGRGLPAILGYGWVGGKRSEGVGEIAEVVDSFEASNRISDIIWSSSNLLVDQSWVPERGKVPEATTPWLSSEVGKKLSVSRDIPPIDLVELYPTAALFGFDPRAAVLSQGKGQRVGPPVIARPRGRVCQASIRGVLSSPSDDADWSGRVVNWGHRGTRSARLHPASNFQVTDDGRIKGGESKGKKPSEVGLGNVPFAGNLDVVPVESIRMDMSISLSALRCDNYGDDALNRSARALLTALALRCMTSLAEGGAIRTACTLVGSPSVRWELIGPGQSETFELDLEAADDLLDEAVDTFGRWKGDTHKVWVNDDVANWLTRDHRKIVESEGTEESVGG